MSISPQILWNLVISIYFPIYEYKIHSLQKKKKVNWVIRKQRYKYQLFPSCHFPSVSIFKIQESVFNVTFSAFPIKTARQATKGGKRETWNKYWACGKEEKTENKRRGKPHTKQSRDCKGERSRRHWETSEFPFLYWFQACCPSYSK